MSGLEGFSFIFLGAVGLSITLLAALGFIYFYNEISIKMILFILPKILPPTKERAHDLERHFFDPDFKPMFLGTSINLSKYFLPRDGLFSTMHGKIAWAICESLLPISIDSLDGPGDEYGVFWAIKHVVQTFLFLLLLPLFFAVRLCISLILILPAALIVIAYFKYFLP